MNNRKGSSPIIHPKKEAEKPEIIESNILLVRQSMAHFGENASGEEIHQIQMRSQIVTLHTTGKRWCVSYYSTEPSGKNKRNRIYGGVNKEKDLQKRMQLLLKLQATVYNSLQINGSFGDKKLDGSTNIFKCTSMMLNEKKRYLKPKSFNSIDVKLKPWKKWLVESNCHLKHPTEITKAEIQSFRNWILKTGLSNRSINNVMDEVRALFNYLKRNHDNLVYSNPCDSITKLPSRSETHVAYTDDQTIKIAEYLKVNDPTLLFYIKFVAYSFLRTNEARTLKIKDIDVANKRILITATNAKTNRRMYKYIPSVFIDEFISRGISNYNGDLFLFSKNGLPGPINVSENFFVKRYKKVKKVFGLSKLHTIYGFRHTFISQLIRSGNRWDEIMKLTGHTTMSSFEKYARSIMELPVQDLSSGFLVKL